VPKIPSYKIKKVNIHEIRLPDDHQAIEVVASLAVDNPYPVGLTVPSLGFEVMVDNCSPTDPFIVVANATTTEFSIHPRKAIELHAAGIVRQLSEALTAACPNTPKSPLDTLLGDYITGQDGRFYIRGSQGPDADAPQWISELLSTITVPVPLPGHTFDHLIKNFSLADVHFHLPDPLAEPDTPDAQPKISAKVKAIVAIPKEMNLPLDVDRVRADADIYHKGKKLGYLDLSKWQRAKSSSISGGDSEDPALLVESIVEDAPLEITDDDLFTDIVQKLIFGKKEVSLEIQAAVDVQIRTALGKFVVRKLPASGVVPIKRG
jgi:hypothetical protein